MRRVLVQLLVLAAFPASALANGHYCDGCSPPLTYGGGPVMDTSGEQGVTVTPVYWQPRGSKNQFTGTYEELINDYIGNVAAASGTDSNVYSIASEYFDLLGGQPRNLRYKITAGAPIVDTQPVPKHGGCRPSSHAYNACITDQQLTAELNRLLTARQLPRGLAHFYPVFFPPGVETDDGSGGRSLSLYCAYHSAAFSGAREIIYSNEPYDPEGGCTGQSPNGNPAADAAIDNLSHELNEALNDPTSPSAWMDDAGAEGADICATYYGPPLGSTDPAAPRSTQYNQVINGGKYWTQTEFSNFAFHRFGFGNGCQPSELAARRTSAPDSPVTNIYFNPSPNTVDADGKDTSDVFVQVWGKHHIDTPGDRIFFTTYVQSGDGDCGTVRPRAAITDGGGTVAATYHASRSTAACVIVANDSIGGRSAAGVIYQGHGARLHAPLAKSRFPAVIKAGLPTTFTTKLINRRTQAIGAAQVSFLIFFPDQNAPNVRADKVRLEVSWHGRRGPFVPVKLSGSTVNAAGITGVIGGKSGFTLGARTKRTLTYRMTVSPSVPHRIRPLFQFEAFLEQVNPASGSEAVLADSGTKNVKVR